MLTESPHLGVAILIVDDNAAKRLALRSALQPLGHVIIEADSGLTALRCIMARDFAVILLDVRMPIMNGFETAALIRKRRQSELTPIIFITAFGSDEIADTDLDTEGAVDFMFTPVPPDELRSKVAVLANLFSKAAGLVSEDPLTGLAVLDPGRMETTKKVLVEADDALYQAKPRGRNGIERVARRFG